MTLAKLYKNLGGVLLLVVFILTAAAFKSQELPISLYPETSRPSVFVHINPKGLSQAEFIQEWSKKMLPALEQIEGVSKVSNNNYQGYSNFKVEFDWGIEPLKAMADVKNMMSGFEARIPRSWGSFYYSFSGSMGKTIGFSLQSKQSKASELERLADDLLITKIQRVQGVMAADVQSREQNIRISLDRDRLNQYGIMPSEVSNQLRAKEYDRGLGSLVLDDTSQYSASVKWKASSLEELADTVIATREQRSIRLRDLATLEFIMEERSNFLVGANENSTMIFVQLEPDANLKSVADRVTDIVQNNKDSIAPDIKMDILISPARFIDRAISSLSLSVVLAMVIAAFVLYLFFGSMSQSIIIATTMPLSLAGGLILMDLIGIGLNLLSIGGMAIAVGMIVDGTIVVIENIDRHLADTNPKDKIERLAVIERSVLEVLKPTFASALTTIIVFLPLKFTAPVASAILGDLAIVVSCTLLVSVVVSATVIPCLIFWLPSRKKTIKGLLPRFFNWTLNKAKNVYLAFLGYAFPRPRVLIVGALAIAGLAAISTASFVHLEKVILPHPKTDILVLVLNPKAPVKGEEARIAAVSSYRRAMQNEFDDVFSSIGISFEHGGGANIFGILRDVSLFDQARARMEDRFPSDFAFNTFVVPWSPTNLEIPDPPDFRIVVNAPSSEESRKIMESIQNLLARDDRLTQIQLKPSINLNQQMSIKLDEEKLANIVGIGTESYKVSLIEDSISLALEDQFVQKIMLQGDMYDVFLGYQNSPIASPSEIDSFLLPWQDAFLPFRGFTSIDIKNAYDHFYFENGRESYFIEAHFKERYKGDRAANLNEVHKTLMNAELPKGSWFFEDTHKEVKENINSLIIALTLSIALILSLLCLQFGNISQGILSISPIPLGFIGSALALYTFNSELSVNAILGIILVAGTAVNNSILFIDFFNQLREENSQEPISDKLLKTADLRFRPILITTATTLLGMLPIALGQGEGGDILQSLGIAISGGLAISTALTLICLPLMMNVYYKPKANRIVL